MSGTGDEDVIIKPCGVGTDDLGTVGAPPHTGL